VLCCLGVNVCNMLSDAHISITINVLVLHYHSCSLLITTEYVHHLSARPRVGRSYQLTSIFSLHKYRYTNSLLVRSLKVLSDVFTQVLP
jgi:hypothetical protein